MILVFASALGLGAWVQLSRMGPVDWDVVRKGSIMFVPFLVMVALKLGLAISCRAKRTQSEGSPGSVPDDEPFP